MSCGPEAPGDRPRGPRLDGLPPEIVALLELASGREGVTDPEGVDWATVAGLADHHRLRGPLATAMPAGGAGGPATLVTDLQQEVVRTADRFQHGAVPQLEELCAALQGAGVEPTLLKGASLVLSGLLPPGERPMTDLDVLVPRSSARRAQRVVDDLGYRTSASSEVRARAWQWHYQDAPFSHPVHRLGLDLHWHVRSPRHRRPFDVGDLTTTSLVLPSGRGVSRLSDVDELVHLCLHFWSDRAQGRPGAIGQLRDVAAAAGRLDQRDWEELAERTRRRGHADTVAAVLALDHLLLGDPLPPEPHEARALARDPRLTSFAIRRVLVPRADHIQLIMVPHDVDYTAWRNVTSIAAYVRRGPAREPGSFPSPSANVLAWARHLRHVGRFMAQAVRGGVDTWDERALDRWAHHLDD